MPRLAGQQPEYIEAQLRAFIERRRSNPVMRNVAHVLVNRLHAGRWGHTLAGVCLWGAAFSSWNALMTINGKTVNNPDRMALAATPETDEDLMLCDAILQAAVAGEPDPTHGALFYYRKGSPEPSWAVGHTPCLDDGLDLFFNDVH